MFSIVILSESEDGLASPVTEGGGQSFLEIERIHSNQNAFHRVREILSFGSQAQTMTDYLGDSLTHLDVGPVHPEPEFLQGHQELVVGLRWNAHPF